MTGASPELPAETVGCLARAPSDLGHLLACRIDEVGDRAQGTCGFAVKIGPTARRPEQQEGGRAGAEGEPPAREAVRDHGARRGNRHRQHEGQQRPRRGRREVAVDHAREEHDEADDRHRAGGEPRAPRAERPERDEDRADATEPEVREQALARCAGEVDEHEQGERAERREYRRLRLADHLVRDREDRRDDDRCAGGALQRGEIRHG